MTDNPRALPPPQARTPNLRSAYEAVVKEIFDAPSDIAIKFYANIIEGHVTLTAQVPTISLEVYQQDWVPGFAAFLDNGTLRETGKAHLMINIGTMLSCVESGELPPKDFPYMVAETLMHEAIHALEAWAKVEFSEEKIEELCQKYRTKYRPEDEVHWRRDHEAKRDDSNKFEAASAPQEAGTSTVSLSDAVKIGRKTWQEKYGDCSMCTAGDRPEWSPYAKCFIHRHDKLDRRCGNNPPAERGVPLEEKK